MAGAAIAEVTQDQYDIWARTSVFALPHGNSAVMHQVRYIAIIPISNADKALLIDIVSSLKIEN